MQPRVHLLALFAFAAVAPACSASKSEGAVAPTPTPPVVAETFDPQKSLTCGTTPISKLPDDPTATVAGIDRATLVAALSGDGLVGWMHGAVPGFSQYVLTYRAPDDFFSHVEMSMVPATDAVANGQLAVLHRHDKVKVKGSFIRNKAPLGHILVDSVEVVQRYTGPEKPYPAYEAKFPDDLNGIGTTYGVVHAQVVSGGAVVLEHKDAIMPVFVSEKHRPAAAQLFRGDVVKINFVIQSHPNAPTHISTDESVDDAITVMDHMVWCHGQKATLTGELVVFPKSEQITTDVYALHNVDGNGMQRNFTLVNFDDQTAFAAIQAKAAAAWTANKATAQLGRNHLINPKLRVTAKGTMNVVSMSQANPQILLDSVDAMTIDVLP